MEIGGVAILENVGQIEECRSVSYSVAWFTCGVL